MGGQSLAVFRNPESNTYSIEFPFSDESKAKIRKIAGVKSVSHLGRGFDPGIRVVTDGRVSFSIILDQIRDIIKGQLA
jgi:hypothetical protein